MIAHPLRTIKPLLIFSHFFFAAPFLPAQQNGIEQDSELITVPAGDKLFRWYGYEGRSYFVQVSDANDPLGKWNWAPVIESGNDEDISYEVDGTAPRSFFRLKYTDQVPGPNETLESADFDQDGISNIDEIVPPTPLLTSDATDPLDADTDHDGLPDGWELDQNIDPNDDGSIDPNNGPNGDSDNDGVSNIQEYLSGTDSGNGSDFPLHMVTAERWEFGKGLLATGPGSWAFYNLYGWSPNSFTQTNEDHFSLDLMIGKLAGLPYPQIPGEASAGFTRNFTMNTGFISGSKTTSDGSISEATIRQQGVWLKAPPNPELRQYKFLKITEKKNLTATPTPAPNVTVDPVTIEIQPNQTHSAPYELAALPDLVVASEMTAYCRLVPIEIDQQNYRSTQGIRFCRWLDSFTGNTLDSDCADKDRDRFRIRIPIVLPNLTKIHIKSLGLATAVIGGQWVSKYSDGDYDVTMTEENGAMVSKWMLLVSDGDDDVGYNGIGTDDGPNDQTLLANFNSPIEVTLPEYQNAKTVFFAQKPLGDLEIQPYYLSPAGDVPPAMADLITNHLEKMKEIYRQIGVRVGNYGIVGKAVPQAWFDAVPAPNEVADYFTPSESNLARAAVRGMAVPGKQIRIGFVNATVMQDDPSPFKPPFRVRGFTITETDGIIVSIEQNDARTIIGVTAHEVGHALGLNHTSVPSSERWLLRGAPGEVMIWNNKPPDSKHFNLGDFDNISNGQSFYVPN